MICSFDDDDLEEGMRIPFERKFMGRAPKCEEPPSEAPEGSSAS